MAAVAAAVAGVQPGQWLLGGSWDESRWGGQMPSADWIDAGEEFTAKVQNVQGGRLAVPGVYSRWESHQLGSMHAQCCLAAAADAFLPTLCPLPCPCRCCCSHRGRAHLAAAP